MVNQIGSSIEARRLTQPRSPRSVTERARAAAVDIERKGRGFCLSASMALPRPIGEVFEFFADAGNLDLLTPTWLRFKILSPLPITMRQGLRLDYRLRIRGIPVTWQSEITVWEPPHRFVDEQRKGPYRYWIHQHRFASLDGGTEVFDQVEYAMPGGRFLHDRLVAPDLRAIFRFRQEKLMYIFCTSEAPVADTSEV
jgi:ligand-binding SRPBCC domain-containing protein